MSKSQFTQAKVIIWTAAKWPMIFTFRFGDGKIIDAGEPMGHEPLFIECPIFVTI